MAVIIAEQIAIISATDFAASARKVAQLKLIIINEGEKTSTIAIAVATSKFPIFYSTTFVGRTILSFFFFKLYHA